MRLAGSMLNEFSIEADSDKLFMVETMSGQTRQARQVPSLDDARSSIDTIDEIGRVTFVLVASDEMADTNAFRLYDVSTRGTGERFISDTSSLIACNTLGAR